MRPSQKLVQLKPIVTSYNLIASKVLKPLNHAKRVRKNECPVRVIEIAEV